MSSIEPDSSGGEVDGGEEISGGFVIACGDGSELFELAEEILDQVARLVELAVKRAGGGAVSPERDDGGFAGLGQGLDDPLIGIIGPRLREGRLLSAISSPAVICGSRASAPIRS